MPDLRLRRTEPDLSSGPDALRHRLAEVVAWCADRADPARPRDCLRSGFLAPRALERGYFDAVAHVAMSRRIALGKDAAAGPSPLAGGRLLAYFPDAELADGAAEAATDGYFDAYGAPPWDTWVAFAADEGHPESSWRNSYGHYLVAWVPPRLVEVASAGIDATAERSLDWLRDTDAALARVLRQHPGWLGG